MRGESWRHGERPHERRERADALPLRALRLALPLLASLALILVWGLASITLTVVPAAHAAGSGQVAIVTPAPDSNGNAQGPVGAYVTISAQNLNAQDTYVIGVGIAPGGCSVQIIPSGSQGVAPDANGNLVTTIIWPSAANAVGSSYYICLQDHSLPSSPPLQSTGYYTVRAANPPSISTAPAQQTGNSGPPGPIPPQSANTYYSGSQITITGANFVPGGEPLAASLLDHQSNSPSDLQSATPLPTVDNATISADNNGSFTATVQLPALQSGRYYVYVTSQDAQNGTYPSLIAVKTIRIVPQPTPTPTATATATPAPTATPIGGPGTGTGGGSNNLGAVIGLGVTSVLLFVIGVILLASAASMPRPRP